MRDPVPQVIKALALITASKEQIRGLLIRIENMF